MIRIAAASVAVAVAGLVPPNAAQAAPSCATPSQQISKPVPWTHERLAPQRVWQLTRGDGITVAVVDTGVDGSVPQLAGHVLTGYDVVNGSGRADDDCFGHGTFVAGIIAAQPVPGTGVIGLAPGVRILPVRQANGQDDGSSSTLAQAIRIAVDAGAKVINISASAFFPSDELREAVRYAAARDVVLVAAAANEAMSGNPTAYPAAYPEVIAVGSVGPDGRRSEFSEVGSYLDLVAPGVDVVSLSRAGAGHLVDSGTSYATPFVSATAALVRAYHPELSAAQVKHRLEATADHPATALPDPQLGWGIVNPYQAVSMVLPEEHLTARRVTVARIDPLVPPPPDTEARDVAITFSLGAVALAGGLGLLAYLIPRGIRRRWRSAGDPSEEDGR